MADNSMWNSQELASLMQPLKDKWQRLTTFANSADQIANDNFPGSARDSSEMNAFRHALGTGMLARELGGGPVASTAAKLAGYGWEGVGALQQLYDKGQISPAYKLDTLHDLNANSHGAAQAQLATSEADLINRLKALAQSSVQTTPPGAFESAVPYMTRTVK